MQNKWHYLAFLLICVLSRIISAIYYPEDPDSLSFSLCVSDWWSFLSYQEYSFGSLVFCFSTKIFYFISGSLPLAFSIIGGLSLYLLISSVLRLLRVPLYSLEGGLLAMLIFFNPLIWLMSNRYSPDLMGLAAMMAAFSYLALDTYDNRNTYNGYFLSGLLLGIKSSYFPFLIIPLGYTFFWKKKYFKTIFFLLCGILIWGIPEMYIRGADNFMEVIRSASLQAFEFKIQDDKLIALIRSLWADSFSGYWIDRNPFLIIYSLGLIVCAISGFFILMTFGYSRSKIIIAAGSWMLYVAWLFFFRDNISVNREVIPLIPFIVILISYGAIYLLVNFDQMYVKILMLVFLLAQIALALTLAAQHTELTAIAKAKKYIIENNSGHELTIISTSQIHDYLSLQKIQADYISVNQDSLFFYKDKINSIKKGKIISIGKFPALIDKKPDNVVHFQHNPYVNRFCPDLYLYEYNLP